MKVEKKQRIRLAAVLAAAVVVAVGLAVWSYANDPSRWFPMWEEVASQPATNYGATIKFAGINWPEGEETEMELLIHVKSTTDQEISLSDSFRIEYQKEDMAKKTGRPINVPWYAVYSREQQQPDPPNLNGRDSTLKSYFVPTDLFRHPGEYRIHVEGLGYCDIDMMRFA